MNGGKKIKYHHEKEKRKIYHQEKWKGKNKETGDNGRKVYISTSETKVR